MLETQDKVIEAIDETEHEIFDLIYRYRNAEDYTERMDISSDISTHLIELRNIAYAWGIKKGQENN